MERGLTAYSSMPTAVDPRPERREPSFRRNGAVLAIAGLALLGAVSLVVVRGSDFSHRATSALGEGASRAAYRSDAVARAALPPARPAAAAKHEAAQAPPAAPPHPAAALGSAAPLAHPAAAAKRKAAQAPPAAPPHPAAALGSTMPPARPAAAAKREAAQAPPTAPPHPAAALGSTMPPARPAAVAKREAAQAPPAAPPHPAASLGSATTSWISPPRAPTAAPQARAATQQSADSFATPPVAVTQWGFRSGNRKITTASGQILASRPLTLWMVLDGNAAAAKQIRSRGSITIDVRWMRENAGATPGAENVVIPLTVGSRDLAGSLAAEVQRSGFFTWHTWAEKTALSPGTWDVSLTYPNGQPLACGSPPTPCRFRITIG
jgi:hypothetical protein